MFVCQHFWHPYQLDRSVKERSFSEWYEEAATMVKNIEETCIFQWVAALFSFHSIIHQITIDFLLCASYMPMNLL